jgi:hypothetical protein
MKKATSGIAQSCAAAARLECKTRAEWGSVQERGSQSSGPDFECQFRFHAELTAQAMAGVIVTHHTVLCPLWIWVGKPTASRSPWRVRYPDCQPESATITMPAHLVHCYPAEVHETEAKGAGEPAASIHPAV